MDDRIRDLALRVAGRVDSRLVAAVEEVMIFGVGSAMQTQKFGARTEMISMAAVVVTLAKLVFQVWPPETSAKCPSVTFMDRKIRSDFNERTGVSTANRDRLIRMVVEEHRKICVA